MIVINEWLPNPKGNDAKGEWIELMNTGSSTASIEGWHLKTSHNKKLFQLHGSLLPGEYRIFPRSFTKLTFRNKDEGVLLYDASNRLVDTSSFAVIAPEGKSFGRRDNGTFIFTDPTPGVRNANAAPYALIHEEHPFNVSLIPQLGAGEFLFLLFSSALCITVAILFILNYIHDASHQLFS